MAIQKVESAYITAPEVAAYCGVSISMAYTIIRKLNNELKEKGYYTIDGRVPKSYFNERFYGRMPEK